MENEIENNKVLRMHIQNYAKTADLKNNIDSLYKEKTNVKPIRIHDLRHSHVSLLIELGLTSDAISERVGHESKEMTLRYAHLFPSKQFEISDKLNI